MKKLRFFNPGFWGTNFKSHPLLSIFFWCLLFFLCFSIYRMGDRIITFYLSFTSAQSYLPQSDSTIRNAYLVGILLYIINILPMYFIGWFCLKATYNSILNNPFIKSSITSLKILGVVVIFLQILKSFDNPVLIGLLAGVFLGHPEPNYSLSQMMDLYFIRLSGFTSEIILGCFLIVLSIVFKKGSFIKQENDLTV